MRSKTPGWIRLQILRNFTKMASTYWKTHLPEPSRSTRSRLGLREVWISIILLRLRRSQHSIRTPILPGRWFRVKMESRSRGMAYLKFTCQVQAPMISIFLTLLIFLASYCQTEAYIFMDQRCVQPVRLNRFADGSAQFLPTLLLSFAFCAPGSAHQAPATHRLCSPLAVLEEFRAKAFPDYDVSEKSVRIDDRGATWEATFFTPPEKRDPHRLHVGGDFPFLVIDKATCTATLAKVFQ